MKFEFEIFSSIRRSYEIIGNVIINNFCHSNVSLVLSTFLIFHVVLSTLCDMESFQDMDMELEVVSLRDHSFSMFTKFSEKVTFLTPDTHACE